MVLLCYCVTVLLCYCVTVLLCYCVTVLTNGYLVLTELRKFSIHTHIHKHTHTHITLEYSTSTSQRLGPVENLKNQSKYSKNNGVNPSSNRWMVKKLWAKKLPKNHSLLTVHWFQLGFSPLFLEYFSGFLRIFFYEYYFIFIVKVALKKWPLCRG